MRSRITGDGDVLPNLVRTTDHGWGRATRGSRRIRRGDDATAHFHRSRPRASDGGVPCPSVRAAGPTAAEMRSHLSGDTVRWARHRVRGVLPHGANNHKPRVGLGQNSGWFGGSVNALPLRLPYGSVGEPRESRPLPGSEDEVAPTSRFPSPGSPRTRDPRDYPEGIGVGAVDPPGGGGGAHPNEARRPQVPTWLTQKETVARVDDISIVPFQALQ